MNEIEQYYDQMEDMYDAQREVFDEYEDFLMDIKEENIESLPKNNKIEKNEKIETTISKSKMKLKTVGKLAIAALAIHSIAQTAQGQNRKPSRKIKNNMQNKSLPRSVQYTMNQYKQFQQQNNMQTMQLAKDISSYRYGKHMTGFINA